MEKLLAYVYWDVRRFAKWIYDDGYDHFKAVAVMCIAEVSALAALQGLISIGLGHRLLPSSRGAALVSALIVAGVVGLANSLCEDRWGRFGPEFKAYSNRQKLFADVAVFIGLFGAIVGSILILGLIRDLPQYSAMQR